MEPNSPRETATADFRSASPRSVLLIVLSPGNDAFGLVDDLMLSNLHARVSWRSRVMPGVLAVSTTVDDGDGILGRVLEELLRHDPSVAFVGRDGHAKRMTAPNDGKFHQQTSIGRVCIESAWSHGTDGSGVITAVIDQGTDYYLPDLFPNIWTNAAERDGAAGIDDDGNGIVDDVHGAQFLQPFDTLISEPNNPAETYWFQGLSSTIDHGTPIASIIGAVGNNDADIAGVAWRARVMPVRVAGQFFMLSDVLAGIEYAYGEGARVFNCSWVFGDQASEVLLYKLMRETNGALYVIAAGNQNLDLDIPTNRLAPASFDLPNVITVGGTTDEDLRWDDGLVGSNWGRTSVDLFAPGAGVFALSSRAGTEFDNYTGTSFAAPIVAGVAALLWTDQPELTPAQIRTRLMATVTPLPHLRDRCVSGGLLNAAAALGVPCE
jgi:thermitase